MKFRKLGLFGKRRDGRHGARTLSKMALRKSLVETLEKRELLNADWNPELFRTAGFYFNQEGMDSTMAYLDSRFGSGGSGSQTGGSSLPEGGPNDIVTVAEEEPNQGFNNAQYIPEMANNFGVNIIGNNTAALDVDWFSFDLQAGDILDARLAANAASLPLLSLYNSSSREMVSSRVVPGALPDTSPLTGSASAPGSIGDVALHYVVPTSGRYFMRLSDVLSSYTLSLRKHRPVLESEPVGTKQIMYLDFDGSILSRSLFGLGTGSARLGGISDFLNAYGLEQRDEGRFINEVVSRVQSKFDTLGNNTTNPSFDIEIRSSKDHPDPWGNQHVSRVVIGGTFQDLVGDPTATNDNGLIGIAQSVDPGNFDTEETAIIMNDVLINAFQNVPISSANPRIEVIAELMATVVAHEAGHFFGGWHHNPNNSVVPIMDQLFEEITWSGAGPDGVFGTVDDRPLQFGVDGFANPGSPFEPGGINDVVSFLGWGLSSGKTGGFVEGTVYVDNNLNRTLDGGDTRLPNVRVYVDANNNARFDDGDYSAFSNSNGDYRILVPTGSHVVRSHVPDGMRPIAPADNARNFTVSTGETVRGEHFGYERLDLSITGRKWNDFNGNGLRESGEPPIVGVRIYVDLDGDGRIDIGEPSAKTDQNGEYKLNFPGAGTFTIREVAASGYVQTFPGADTDFAHRITLTGDPTVDRDRVAGLDFGNTLTVDFGDAPQSYGVASHGLAPGLRLGTEWDAEESQQFSADARGDDLNGPTDDEDGVVLARPLVSGSDNNRVTVTVTNDTGSTAYLNGWIDYNQDGDFNDSGEQIFQARAVSPGENNLTFSTPESAALGNTFARFRLSQEQNLGPTGEAGGGEVEDYMFTIVDTLNLAVDDRFSVTRNSSLNELDVLENDFRLPGESLEIIPPIGATSAGGVVQITSSDTLLYTPPTGFIGQDVFTYRMRNSGGDTDEATVVVDVNLFFDEPLAVDDSFDVATNAIDFPLNVLANDIEGQAGALTIISVTQPDKGGQINISSGGKALRYTPARGFGGSEFFSYTVADGDGNQSSAEVTLHTLPGDRADDDVMIRFVTTDMQGNPITAIPQGGQFKLDMMVDDLRFDADNPGAAAGVFSAYTDVLYDLQLVSTVAPDSPSDRFNFDVEFFNQYLNFQTGDASVPGIIDEFGAFADRSIMNEPDPLRLASITFEARSPGIARFMPDPADEFPDSETLLFDTPGSQVPIERIRYLGTMLEVVGDAIEFPVAVDDSLTSTIPSGAIQFPINVLANDLPGSQGPISIFSFGDGLNGSTQIDTRGTADPSDDRILYTPNSGFNGADQFQYTIQDSRGIQSTATVTVQVGTAAENDVASVRLQATDSNGAPIDEVDVGSEFQLRAYVQDLRSGNDLGIAAAYLDVLFSRDLVSPVATTGNDPDLGFQIQFGPNYQSAREGDIRTDGLINEVGAFSPSQTPLGGDEQLLFVITMTADATGLANFIGDPADILPLHDTLTFEPPAALGFDRIRYGFDSLNIVGGSTGGGSGEGFTNLKLPLDVNDDGHVTPIDALLVINALNSGGPGPLTGGGEGETQKRTYIDTNADKVLSPIDALLVINYLNSRTSGPEGEGEGGTPSLAASVDLQPSLAVDPSNPVREGSKSADKPSAESGQGSLITDDSERRTGSPDDGRSSDDVPEYVAATDSFFGDDEDEEDSLLDELSSAIGLPLASNFR